MSTTADGLDIEPETTRAPGIRAKNRADIQTALLVSARRQLAERGAAALSLRAIARDLDMVPSALFRYVASRDELLTLLIVDAYTDLAVAVEAVEAAVDRTDLRGRWRAIATSFRAWALTHPYEYALLYGSPVPDYAAPPERTNAAGTRVATLLLALAAELGAERTGLRLDDDAENAAQAVAGLLLDSSTEGIEPRLLVRGLVAWNTVVGSVSAEVFQQFGPAVGDMNTLFDYAVDAGERLMFDVLG